jgi:chromosome partitioning protein
MQVISIINYKGGVGKTTLTANLAAKLGAWGKRVLLLDMDAQCSLTFSFVTPDEWQRSLGGTKTTEDKTIKRWFDGISDDDLRTPTFNELIISDLKVNQHLGSSHGRIDLIPSHLGLINVDLDLAYMLTGVPPGRVDKQRSRVYGKLRSHLGDYAKQAEYDFVLIDCPPNFNIVTKNAIVASDGILIPAKPDYLSTLGIDYLVRNYGTLLDEFNKDSGGSGIRPEILGVVFTMVQFYGGEPISAQRDYMHPSDVPVFSSLVRENKTIFADAPENGVPVVLTGHREGTYGTIVTEMESLAREFCDKVGVR